MSLNCSISPCYCVQYRGWCIESIQWCCGVIPLLPSNLDQVTCTSTLYTSLQPRYIAVIDAYIYPTTQACILNNSQPLQRYVYIPVSVCVHPAYRSIAPVCESATHELQLPSKFDETGYTKHTQAENDNASYNTHVGISYHGSASSVT